MRKLNRLLLAAMVLAPLTACDEGDNTITPAPPAPIIGSVSGTVSVEGAGVADLTVQLGGSSAATTTTQADGSFSFSDVVEGNYSLTLSDIPADYAFPTTTQSVTIATQGQSVTADFNGSWVRTASLLVNVERADGSGAATTVRLEGEGEDQTLNTNAQGVITFSGLKAGDYTVSLPTPPEGFTETSATVSLSTGQVAQINFVGERELLPPTITIASIIEASTGDDRERLNNINEEVLVVMDVNPNGNQLTSVEFWALEKRTGDVFRVGTQRFASTVGGPELVDGIYRAEFFFDQDESLRRRDGSHPSIEQLGAEGFEAIGPNAMRPYHPIFANGDYEFHGVVTVAEFPGETFNAIVDVTLNNDACEGNCDRVILRVESDNSDWNDPETGEPFPNQLLDEDGFRWLSGDIMVTAYPVIFSAPYNPNDPMLAFMDLYLEDGGWVYDKEPSADGSFFFKFCENETVPNTEATGECDADYSGVQDDNIYASIETVTRFGQAGTSWAEYWFEDLYSGVEDDLRVDNRSPEYGGTFDVDLMPHPANAIEGVEDFERSAVPSNFKLGWVTWSDTITHAFSEPGLDADDGIGMPGDADNQPTLFYITGPDAADPDGDVVEIFEDASAVEVFDVFVASDLTPETDSPGLEDVGSAEGTPFSDSEFDYYMTARSWDRFGNWILADTDVADHVSLGVDGLAPIFTDEDGVAEDPADPTTLTSVYNTYDDGYYAPCTVDEDADDDFDCDYVGELEFHDFEYGYGEYIGYATDTGNGFAGLEGMVIEDWAYGDGTVAGDSRFGYDLADSGLMYWCYDYSCDFTIDAYADFNNDSETEVSYRDQKVHAFDRAGNQKIVDNVSEHIVDQSPAYVNAPSVPAGPLALDDEFTISVNVEDSVDLKKTLGGFEFDNGPLGDLYGGEAGYIWINGGVVDHTAFGSAEILTSATVTMTMNLTPCASTIGPKFGDQNAVWAGFEESDYVTFTTFDHSSPYGLADGWDYNSADISTAYGEFTCFDSNWTDEEIDRVFDGDLIVDLDVTSAGKPVVSFAGVTSTFSTELHAADFTWYYQDIGGFLMPLDTEESDWTLNVSDTGGDEEDARVYSYTYTGDLPADLIEADGASSGTVDGFTFMWNIGGGNLILWSETTPTP